ncbi:MAG: MBL fold metallo-hydrolase, partial [Gemmatimonadaceae bacterium]|nr:MBL fold metallo-hydrolase [Acetobacteraceae bacterium]
QSLRPEAVSLVFNTHAHCDHAGGNHALQHRYGLPIAAQADEAAAVNRRDPDACRAEWLRQPIEPYQVDRVLRDGDKVGTGEIAWTVVATPGHTAGHLSLHSAEHGVLVLGDALHGADLGWINPYREDAGSLDQTADTIERLSGLPARIGYSGHGPAITDLPAAYDHARRRIRSWRDAPERMAWHACKRIFAHALMLTDGLEEAAIAPMLLDAPWFRAHAEGAFGLSPATFVPLLLTEMQRGDAAHWREGRLVATARYTVPAPGWATAPTSPLDWPPIRQALSAALD